MKIATTGSQVPDPLDLLLPQGAIYQHESIVKFGRTTNADNGVETDVHDGANATDNVAVWVAPTQARTHQIVSTDVGDDGAPVGAGARTMRIFGLTAWDELEVSEDIILNGTTNVPTVNEYVIINRMEVLTKGATSANIGVITATADVDGTVTSQINADNGGTLQAIYGVPSTRAAYITQYYATAVKAASGAAVSITLRSNPEPDAEITNFFITHASAVASDGATHMHHTFSPWLRLPGPNLIKLSSNSSANDTEVSGGFTIILAPS